MNSVFCKSRKRCIFDAETKNFVLRRDKQQKVDHDLFEMPLFRLTENLSVAG
jgi:hypothetical protein